jgi:hypothetical protein
MAHMEEGECDSTTIIGHGAHQTQAQQVAETGGEAGPPGAAATP